MKSFFEPLLDTLFPNQCVLCERPDLNNLCSSCLAQSPQTPVLFTSDSNALFRIPSETSAEVLPSSSALQAILVSTAFQHLSIKRLIHSFKYKNLPQLSYPLSRILLKTYTHHIIPSQPSSPLLCPIPLHSRRKAFRGYNQAELLSDHLKQDLSLTTYSGLVRIKHTPQQMKNEHRTDRINNMRNAFQANIKPNNPVQPIILIDDVTTTLSTLEESAKALRKAGFQNIYGLVLAH